MSILERTTFEIPRAAEYFDAGELEKQTGRPQSEFAAVVLKELVDNGIDAAETQGVAPEIELAVTTRGSRLCITVGDNGPGLSAATIERLLNFNTRTSDKSAYRSPTRGAQGNALKTVIGIPFALALAEPVTIEAQGIKHTICARADPTGAPRITHRTEPIGPRQGTRISVTLPWMCFCPDRWAKGFSLFNPHATVRIRVSSQCAYLANPISETENSYQPTVSFPADGWRKFLPTDLTSAWWYSVGDLARLICLHNNAAANGGGRALTLREFVKQFRGLSGSAKAKQICDAFPGGRLADFDTDPAPVVALLEQMKEVAQMPSPHVLGKIGELHFRHRFEEWYGVRRFWYSKADALIDGIPFCFEVAIAQTKQPGDIFTGVNFSPTFTDPLAGTLFSAGECRGYGISGFLVNAHVLSSSDDAPPMAVAVHLVCPALHFLDRGKSTLHIHDAMRQALAGALWKAARELYREGEQRRKDAARSQRKFEHVVRQSEKAERQQQWKQNEAVFAVLEEAMNKASGGGEYPVSARTLYYQVRPLLQAYTAEPLEYKYFSQTLLTAYQKQYGPLTGLYYDPRGVLYEPHGGREVQLGTREVEGYEFPEWVYNKILYVEKKGLWPQIQQAKLAERYDMAVMASEGFATEAARFLLARADRQQQYRFFVLHDADPSGYEIARTLREETDRMPGYQVEVIDLGLFFEEALDLGLQTEHFTRKKRLSGKLQLTDLERVAFTGRPIGTTDGKTHWDAERVEINAFTAPELLAYIERKLTEAGADDKVIPPGHFLTQRARSLYDTATAEQVAAVVGRLLRELLDLDSLQASAERVGMRTLHEGRAPVDFSQARTWVEEALNARRASTWGDELTNKVKLMASTLPTQVGDAIEEHLRERLRKMGAQ